MGKKEEQQACFSCQFCLKMSVTYICMDYYISGHCTAVFTHFGMVFMLVYSDTQVHWDVLDQQKFDPA